MPSAASTLRSTQGANELIRGQRRQPVSNRASQAPKRPAGIRWVANGALDHRAVLALTAVSLLAGHAMATTTARVAERPQGRLVPQRVGFLPELMEEAMRPLAVLAEAELKASADAPAGGGSLLWQGIAAWFASPCRDFDEYVNGFWRLQHPPARSSVPTFFTEARTAQDEALVQRMDQLPRESTAAAGLLAATWASARTAAGRSWSPFQAQVAAIDALSSSDDIGMHVCMGMREGRESVLGLRRFFEAGMLDASLALQPEDRRMVYQVASDHPVYTAYLEKIAQLLTESGMEAAAAALAAPVVAEMEGVLAQAADDFDRYTLEQGIAEVPGFPWQEAWAALGLDKEAALYASPSACRQLAQLLDQHAVADWKHFLRYQEARRAAFHLRGGTDAGDSLQRLDGSPGGQQLISAWYAKTVDPALLARAETMFEGLRSQFQRDIQASALPAVDKALLDDRLGAAKLRFDGAGSDVDWTAIPASMLLLDNIRALDTLATGQDIQAIRGGPGADAADAPAHRFRLTNHIIDDNVRLSPALLAAVAKGLGSAPDALWGGLGEMLGHELAHTLALVRGLTPEGAALLAREDQAIAQRIGDMWSGGLQLQAASVLEEAACDLRGLSVARRAAEQEAAASGRTFDGKGFFTGFATLHAANPSLQQLRAEIAEGGHPPPPFRAGLAGHVAGFDRAFGCLPRPTAPFERIFTQPLIDPLAGRDDETIPG